MLSSIIPPVQHAIPRKQRGFTLLELMITVAVSIILLTIGIPSFVDMIRTNKLTTNVNLFVQTLHLARSEALKAGGGTLCASKSYTACDGGNWRDGWIIFTDIDGDGSVGVNETIVRVQEALPSQFVITADGLSVTYGRNGFLTPPGTTRSFTFCNQRTGVGAGRAVGVSPAGRPNTTGYDGCS
jgi:type IV fimbrial biogenesis protein FimT